MRVNNKRPPVKHPPTSIPSHKTPSIAKAALIALCFFAAAADGRSCGPLGTHTTYQVAWMCPDPAWGRDLLSRHPGTEHFSVRPHSLRGTVTALAFVDVDPSGCIAPERFVKVSCYRKS